MGDRALVQVKAGGEFSPVLYLHWSGSSVPKLLAGLAAQMLDRGPDLPYTFARLVGRAVNLNGGNNEALSVGVSNAETVLTEEDSQGDAGVFVLDVKTGVVQYGGGYTPKWRESDILHPLSEHPYTWAPISGPVTRYVVRDDGEGTPGRYAVIELATAVIMGRDDDQAKVEQAARSLNELTLGGGA